MGGTFSLRKTRLESVGISGGHWSSIDYGRVLYANNGRFAIFFYSVIAFFVLLYTFLWNKVIIKSKRFIWGLSRFLIFCRNRSRTYKKGLEELLKLVSKVLQNVFYEKVASRIAF